MVTPGLLPSRDTRKSLYIAGEGREQDAEASPAQINIIAPGTALLQARLDTYVSTRYKNYSSDHSQQYR